jgi:lipocalin
MPGDKIISLLLVVLLHTPFVAAQCPPVGFDAKKNFNSTKYIGDRWYSLKELPVFYLPVSRLYCVFADYGVDTRKSPSCFLFGRVVGCRDPPAISIFNSARDQSTTGKVVSGNLKGTIPDAKNEPAKIYVGLQNQPNFLRRGTNYWVVAAGTYNELPGLATEADSPIYQWAIITAGSPGQVGNNGRCYSRGGVWFFSREPTAPDGALAAIENIAIGLGLDTSSLKPVTQQGCTY